jgi:amino acid transporter/mannitol/fructose-specific phosphotransferase system IIA component (Ntr-type)
MGPAIGTVDGLLTWFSLSLKSAFALVGMGAFVNLLVSIDIRYIALVLCALFVSINLLGIKEAARIQVIIVSILLAIMIYYISRGIPAVSIQRFEPFTPYGIKGIISTTGIVFISFGGLLKVAALAEEVESPGRTIPLGMILSLSITSIIYTLAVFVTAGVLDARTLQSSLTPLTEGARVFGGTFGMVVLSIGAILAFVSTANAGIMAASRYPLALSRDALLPEFLSKINRRFNTPHVSIIMTGGFMIIALFFKLDFLVKAASTVMILTYMFSCLSIIILRESRLQNYQPSFKAPLYPWLQIVGIAGFIIMIYGMGKESFIVSSCLIVGGLFVYWFYGRIRATKEFALLYLIQRITAKELVSRTLESELKEIIRERDEIIKDRFDTLIEGCSIIDIEKSLDVSKLFSIVADSMSKKLRVKPEYILSLLNEREKESSTAITPYLAIPHIIIEGEKIFNIFLVRCKGGIFFNREADNVHAVFILVGTKDERNFHLRALSAIAQIVHDPNFENRWLSAKNEEDLRDIVLLGKRKRSDGV